MHKSNFRAGAMELAEVLPETNDLVLLGPEKVFDVHILPPEFEVDKSLFTKESCGFKSMIGVGHRCYYVIDEYFVLEGEGDQRPFTRERGVGIVLEEDGKLILRRESPLVWSNHNLEEFPLAEGEYLDFGEGEYIIVGSIVPPTYIEALASPNCIISSTNASNPTPVEIDENALVGRKSGVIQSIDMDELEEMLGDRFFDKFVQSEKQLDLKARSIRLSRKNSALSAPILRVMPSYNNKDKPAEVQGNIIFNVDSNCLECFDGTKWRTLEWKED